MEHPLRRPELLVCSWLGHVLPGATLQQLDARHAAFVCNTGDGRRLTQCLRCRDWILVASPNTEAGNIVEEVAVLKYPRRGKALRDAIVLRIIAIDRATHAVVLAAVMAAALALRWNVSAIHGWATDMLRALQSARSGSGGASSHGLLSGLLGRIARLNPHSLGVLAAFAGVYAAVSIAETVGLWRERRWAEYLTSIATAGFLPLEIDELAKKITVVRIGALVINVAILVYLVYSKHLFGARGPLAHEPPEPLEPLPILVPFAGP